ncbi:MAG: ATP-binding protein [Candidatus Hydrogenedentes bacterium]|nr:ATP-binding protein [Candidatus Hydrogenedentota bacterium]
MNSATYSIAGGDYENGGAASKRLKAILKKVGADPKAIRRAMVAAYEAEMNTVIHARGGRMRVAVDASQVDVVVEDEGPGIPHIGQAMVEGYSTAPPEARELGFGAGMGLPNIQRNSDRFSLRSTPGQGTQVHFTVYLTPQTAAGAAVNSVAIAPDRCRQCLRCLAACPTGAIRVREGGPRILEHLCIDCTSCTAACDAGALGLGADAGRERDAETVLVVPGAFLAQFGPGAGPEQVLAACEELGFARVRVLDAWEAALQKAVWAYAQDESEVHPVLAPVCPAVLNLIRLRFPSLLGHVAPFLTPWEAAREECEAARMTAVAACPAQRTVLSTPGLLTRLDVVSPAALYNELHARLGTDAAAVPPQAGRQASACDALQVSGIRHVVKVLDELEDGQMPDCAVLELFACDEGCFGSPAWTEDAFVARHRHERSAVVPVDGAAGAVRRTRPLTPRGGLRLDVDMGRAIEKLARIDALTRALPGRDCGACGAPTCAALAEDVVLGQTDVRACIHLEPGPLEIPV